VVRAERLFKSCIISTACTAAAEMVHRRLLSYLFSIRGVYFKAVMAMQDTSCKMNDAAFYNKNITSMWANAQRDGRPAEYRWHPLFNAAKFG